MLAFALAVSACARRQQQDAFVAIDPVSGRPMLVAAAASQQPAPRYQMPQRSYALAQPQPANVIRYVPPQAQPSYAQAPAQTYAQSGAGGPYVAPRGYAQQPYAAQRYGQGYGQQGYGTYAAAPANVAPSYTLDTGDRLRIVVFGQDGISSNYVVDAAGNVNLPLIGAVPARGAAPQQLSRLIADRLRQGYVREPHVSVEVEAYRPFFILGEVTNPGQYAYVPNMTAETAVAIAGGFAPRARKGEIELTRNSGGQQFHGKVPLGTQLRPGDTVIVNERWF
jgi:polysaccharide export outer membrane protein